MGGGISQRLIFELIHNFNSFLDVSLPKLVTLINNFHVLYNAYITIRSNQTKWCCGARPRGEAEKARRSKADS